MACCDNLSLYLYNWSVFLQLYAGIFACQQLALWGLFFDDDDGAMMNACFSNYSGLMVEFPLHYLSTFSIENPDYEERTM